MAVTLGGAVDVVRLRQILPWGNVAGTASREDDFQDQASFFAPCDLRGSIAICAYKPCTIPLHLLEKSHDKNGIRPFLGSVALQPAAPALGLDIGKPIQPSACHFHQAGGHGMDLIAHTGMKPLNRYASGPQQSLHVRTIFKISPIAAHAAMT
jgi:hypothetical protein